MHGRQQNALCMYIGVTKERNKYRASGETEHEYVSFRKIKCHCGKIRAVADFDLYYSREHCMAADVVYLGKRWCTSMFRLYFALLPYLRGAFSAVAAGVCIPAAAQPAADTLYARWGVCARRENGALASRYSIRWKDNILRRDMPRFRDKNRGGEGFVASRT